MSRELHDLRVALTAADDDTLYRAWLIVKQAMTMSDDRATTEILNAIVTLLDASYTEKALLV